MKGGVPAFVCLGHPAVELCLKVSGAAEAAGGLEVGAHEAVEALQHPLGLRVAGLEDVPGDRQGAECLGGAAGVPDDLIGTCSIRCIRLISAHCSTPNTPAS